MNGKRLATPALNARRRRAVALRQDGLTLARVTEHTGLSAPTIIAACKAYSRGGWEAVDVRPRGRQVGTGRLLKGESELKMRALLAQSPPELAGSQISLWDLSAVRALLSGIFGIELSERTVAGYLASWGFAAPDLAPIARAAELPALRQWMAADYRHIADNARRAGAGIIWASERPLDRGKHQLFAHDARSRMRWLVRDEPPDADAWIDFLARLRRTVGRKLVVVTRTAALERVDALQSWLRQERADIQLVQAPTK